MCAKRLKQSGLSLLVTWLLMLLLGDRSHAAMPQASSTGCNNVNDPLFDAAYQNGDAGFFPFLAGEQIMVQASTPATGSPELVSLSVNGGLVASAPFPATLISVIPADGNYDVSWGVKNGDATWSIDCKPQATATPSPTSLPTGTSTTSTPTPTYTPARTATPTRATPTSTPISTPTPTYTPARTVTPTGATPTSTPMLTRTATPTSMPSHIDIYLPLVMD